MQSQPMRGLSIRTALSVVRATDIRSEYSPSAENPNTLARLEAVTTQSKHTRWSYKQRPFLAIAATPAVKSSRLHPSKLPVRLTSYSE